MPPFTRWRMWVNLRAKLETGHDATWIYTTRIASALLVIIVALFGGRVALTIFNGSSLREHLEPRPYDLYVAIVLCGAACILLLSLVYRLNAFMNPHFGGRRLRFNRVGAPTLAKEAAEVISHCGRRRIDPALTAFVEAPNEPFLLLRGILNLPASFYRRPLSYQKMRDGGGAHRRATAILETADVLCGGLLWRLGVQPEPRFNDRDAQDDPVVTNRFWRPDTEETPDTLNSDIFRRFHQSTIERPMSISCRFKAIAAIGNFRRTPFHIVAVKDVIECLVGDGPEYKNRGDMYSTLQFATRENILELLAANAFDRFPPRMDRFKLDDTAPKQGSVIEEAGPDDWIMSFDPARVWATSGPDQRRYIEALYALRRAIHYVSRKRAFEITLRKRDVLILDNRRALIGRFEDTPAFSLADTISGFYPNLAGRWLRMIYGFPRSSDTQVFSSVLEGPRPTARGLSEFNLSEFETSP
ncbi:MAG: hypothetical protein AAGC56_15240 [Pseudomonadota bacterium]